MHRNYLTQTSSTSSLSISSFGLIGASLESSMPGLPNRRHSSLFCAARGAENEVEKWVNRETDANRQIDGRADGECS